MLLPRVPRAVGLAALLSACAAAACTATHLDVGTTTVDDDAGVSLPEAAPSSTTTTSDTGTSPCASPEGPRDGYASPADLVSRLIGTWVLCPTPAPPFADPVDGIDFGKDGATGTYVVLERKGSLEPQGSVLVKRTDVRGFGTFKILAYADPDSGIAGEAGTFREAGTSTPPGPDFVALDDPKTRGSMLLYLYASDGNADVIVSVDFEKGPRRMFVREVGGTDVANGTFMQAP